MDDPLQISKLANHLGLDGPPAKNHISIVGGGGKTTILHALGKQLQGKTILTSTTKMGFDQNRSLPVYFEPEDKNKVDPAIDSTDEGALHGNQDYLDPAPGGIDAKYVWNN